MLAFVAALTILLLFSGSAVAQVAAPDCLIVPWGWTFNSLNQNACTVAAYLLSTCNMGSFTIDPLQSGYSYTGPSGIDDGNLCKCNTVAYSLISACDACQSETWIAWSEYSFNCTTKLPPSSFPNPVPAGTSVPAWALLDVTLENNWNANKSMATGDSPEKGPGALIGNPGTPTTGTGTGATRTSPNPTGSTDTSSTHGFTSPPTPTPTPTGGSNAGAIAGGVVGGLAAISIAAAALFFFLRRRQRPQAPQAATFEVDGPSEPHMDEYRRPLSDNTSFVPTSVPETPSMRLYDPNDPTTFPGYQPPSPGTDVPYSPYENTNTLASIHTSRPTGYRGLPTV